MNQIVIRSSLVPFSASAVSGACTSALDPIVGGFQVAVDDASFMCGFEGVGDLLNDEESFVDGDCPLRDALSQRWPFGQLQHQRPRVAALFEPVDLRDVGMVQRGEDSGFTWEPGQAFRIIGEQVRQDFESHIAPELRVVSAVDLSHAALTDKGSDLVGAEGGAG